MKCKNRSSFRVEMKGRRGDQEVGTDQDFSLCAEEIGAEMSEKHFLLCYCSGFEQSEAERIVLISPSLCAVCYCAQFVT